MARYLTIDQSTSATKALLLDEHREVLDKESLEHAQSYPQPGWVEQDAEEIYQNTLRACRAVLERNGGKSDVACCSISNQRETIVIFDRQTGKPLHPAIVWQCRRGTEACAEMQKQGHEAEVRRRTGLTLDPYFSASKVHVLFRDNPELKAKLDSGDALVGTMDAYLIYRLTGRASFATDHTNACRTLFYNIGERGWDPFLCELWGIPHTALPEILSCSDNFGTITDADFLDGVAIRGVMGDSHASLFSQYCFSPGMTKVTLGTGSSILMNVGSRPVEPGQGIMLTLGWVHAGEPVYAHEGIIVSSASTLTWLRSQLGIIEDLSQTEELVRQLPGNDGVYLVPAFTGLGLPHWEPSARATICGLSNQSDRRHLLRAALEAIAYQLREALDAMAEGTGQALASVHADGGPTANSFLMQFIADITRIPVRVSKITDGSPVGAAMMGMLGSGLVNSPKDFLQEMENEPDYRPRMSPEDVQTLFNGWQHAVRQTLAK